MNPHKWLFTPLDASLLLTRRMPDLRAAFSLVPEYLRTLDREAPVRDYNEYTPQLGRRFRALKLWIQLRWFGLEGLRRRIERHLEMAQAFARWVDDDPDWERLAPVPFSTVCFRWHPAGAATEAELDRRNAAIMDAVNRTGEVFLSHTRLDGRFTIRLAIGNLRTEPRHVERAWALLREAADRVSPSPQPHDVRFFATPEELRDWFDANHETADELWLGYYRKSTGRAERRLVAGRGRGPVRRLDRRRPPQRRRDDSFVQRFTPRRKGSTWSAINVAKVAALTEQGRMRPAGNAAFEARSEANTAIYSYERAAAAFSADEEARFRAERRGLGRLGGAAALVPACRDALGDEREAGGDTRARRLDTLIADSAAGRKVGPMRWSREK